MSAAFYVTNFDAAAHRPLVELFSREFKEDDKLLSPIYSQWLYRDNPYGPARLVVAEEGGRWVGFLAMIPLSLARRSGVRTGYYVVNVLVDPNLRGKNVFGRMIETAKSLAKGEGALLMGHPNAAALGAWRRAEMRFKAPLQAAIATPGLRLRHCAQPNIVASVNQLQDAVDRYNAQSALSPDWRLMLSTRYLDWRFFRHPTHRYLLTEISAAGEALGFVVTRQLRRYVHLMIDSFMLQGQVDVGFALAPLVTAVFLPRSMISASRGLNSWFLRKELPFFCTDFETCEENEPELRLSLSASDF